MEVTYQMKREGEPTNQYKERDVEDLGCCLRAQYTENSASRYVENIEYI